MLYSDHYCGLGGGRRMKQRWWCWQVTTQIHNKPHEVCDTSCIIVFCLLVYWGSPLMVEGLQLCPFEVAEGPTF